MDKNEANCRKAFESYQREAFAKTHNAWCAFRAAWYIWHPQEFMSPMERIWAQDDAQKAKIDGCQYLDIE